MAKMKTSTKALLAISAAGAIAAAYYFLTKKPLGLASKFNGFGSESLAGGATTRQSTSVTAKDFQFNPLITVTPDINGTYTVTWSYINTFDGVQTVNSGSITNTFTGLVGGTPIQLKLTDNRSTPPRDAERNGAIAIGDKDFIGSGKQDGLWHPFTSAVTATVTSPSTATKTVSGNLTDSFKNTGTLAATFNGFDLTTIV